jgi:hypothetical protein
VFLDETFEWCLREYGVDTLLVTSRSTEDSRGRRSFEQGVDSTVRSLFGKNLVKRFDASGWPGTELIRHTGRVYVVRFDEAVARRMVSAENELFKWRNTGPKHLPEDICVFRARSSFPILFSVTHEKDAIVLSDGKAGPPGFRKGHLPARYWYIWGGPYFCRL